MLGIVDDADRGRVGDAVDFFFNDTATTEIYTLSLHDALPISAGMTETATTGGGVVAGNTVTWDLITGNAGQSAERSLTRMADDLCPADPLVRLTQAAVTSATAAARAIAVAPAGASVALRIGLS